MNASIKTSDVDLKWEILNKLKTHPGIKVSEIGVIVKNGVVTLVGNVLSYGEKSRIITVVQRVNDSGVIIDDIVVSIPESLRKTDSEILKAAKDQIAWSMKICPQTVRLEIKNGWLTVSGEVEWWHQKNSVSNILNDLEGVSGITNSLTIKKYAAPTNPYSGPDQAHQYEQKQDDNEYAHP